MKLSHRSLVMCSRPVMVFCWPIRTLPISGNWVIVSQTSVGTT